MKAHKNKWVCRCEKEPLNDVVERLCITLDGLQRQGVEVVSVMALDTSPYSFLIIYKEEE